MGLRLARQALAEAAKVSPTSRLVLVAMAHQALDRDMGGQQGRLYYAGHSHICAALGIFPTTANLRRVRAAIAELIAAGLVARVSGGHHDRAAVYAVLPVGNR